MEHMGVGVMTEEEFKDLMDVVSDAIALDLAANFFSKSEQGKRKSALTASVKKFVKEHCTKGDEG